MIRAPMLPRDPADWPEVPRERWHERAGALLSDAQAAGRALTQADADREAERLVRASMEYRR